MEGAQLQVQLYPGVPVMSLGPRPSPPLPAACLCVRPMLCLSRWGGGMLSSGSQGPVCPPGFTTERKLPLPMVQAEVLGLIGPAWVMCCFRSNHCGAERSDWPSLRGNVWSQLSKSKEGSQRRVKGSHQAGRWIPGRQVADVHLRGVGRLPLELRL